MSPTSLHFLDLAASEADRRYVCKRGRKQGCSYSVHKVDRRMQGRVDLRVYAFLLSEIEIAIIIDTRRISPNGRLLPESLEEFHHAPRNDQQRSLSMSQRTDMK